MQYEHDRTGDPAGEPSLTEMTEKAIDILTKNPKGFFLMVEGGRIDHAHHAANAYRALTDTIEFARAVGAAIDRIGLSETLVIVTADHSHVFTMAGYPARGNPILGKVTRTVPVIPVRRPAGRKGRRRIRTTAEAIKASPTAGPIFPTSTPDRPPTCRSAPCLWAARPTAVKTSPCTRAGRTHTSFAVFRSRTSYST
jgi:hypothetical protein